MSKAKELARVVEDLYSRSKIWDMNIDSEISDIVYLSVDLCRARLSPPQPEKKGWIECKRTDIRYLRRLVNLETGVQLIEIENQNVGCCLQILDTEDDRAFAESYDSIKQKIKEAS